MVEEWSLLKTEEGPLGWSLMLNVPAGVAMEVKVKVKLKVKSESTCR